MNIIFKLSFANHIFHLTLPLEKLWILIVHEIELELYYSILHNYDRSFSFSTFWYTFFHSSLFFLYINTADSSDTFLFSSFMMFPKLSTIFPYHVPHIYLFKPYPLVNASFKEHWPGSQKLFNVSIAEILRGSYRPVKAKNQLQRQGQMSSVCDTLLDDTLCDLVLFCSSVKCES